MKSKMTEVEKLNQKKKRNGDKSIIMKKEKIE